MSRSSRSFVAPALALLLACGSALGARPDLPALDFEPDSESAGDLNLERGMWLLEGAEITLMLGRLDDDARAGYLARNIGLSADPFATAPNRNERYYTYVFVIENRGERPVTFNPRTAWMATNRGKVQSPLSITDLSFDYKSLGGDLPPAYSKIRSVLFENSIEVQPGTSASGLLVYRPVEAGTRSFAIDLRVMDANAESIAFAAPYKRIKKKKKKRDD